MEPALVMRDGNHSLTLRFEFRQQSFVEIAPELRVLFGRPFAKNDDLSEPSTLLF